MNTITEELVTLDINGRTLDCYVWGWYHPAYDGGHEEKSEPEMYELTRLYADLDGKNKQQEISEILMIDFVRDDIVKQLKESTNE